MPDITLQPLSRRFTHSMSPPGSKSLTNRALVLAALSSGSCRLQNVLLADDTLIMLDCLQRLGFSLNIDRPRQAVEIHGRGGEIPARRADLFCGNSGTTIRFLTALCAMGTGTFTLDGIERMRQRPIAQLVDMLRQLGVRSTYMGAGGFPPLQVLADRLPGGSLRVVPGESSQFLSAVLQVAPFARHEVRIDLEGRQTSWPYVEMTMRLMDVFGHTPHLIRDPDGEPRQIIVPQGSYPATDYEIEPDASNATYFLAAAALHPGSTLTLRGLGKHSLQGDVGFADLLRRMGASVQITTDTITVSGPDQLYGIEADMLSMPDTAQTLAVTALFAEGPTVMHGLHTLRLKETDRVTALANELTRLGAVVTIEGDSMTITPPKRLNSAEIQTYDDHRMAMSFALAGTRVPGITIMDAQCVAKTYPKFFDDLSLLGMPPQSS